MIARVFVDSNILIYAHNIDAGTKHQRAAEWLGNLWNTRAGCLSTQVLQEFYVNVTQKIKTPLGRSTARDVIRNYALWVNAPVTPATVIRASEIGEIWQLSFWDGMIVAAAEQAGAAELLSEDMNPGQVIAGVKIVNPFVV